MATTITYTLTDKQEAAVNDMAGNGKFAFDASGSSFNEICTKLLDTYFNNYVGQYDSVKTQKVIDTFRNTELFTKLSEVKSDKIEKTITAVVSAIDTAALEADPIVEEPIGG